MGVKAEGMVWSPGRVWEGFLKGIQKNTSTVTPSLCACPTHPSPHHRGQHSHRWACGSEQARSVPDTHQQVRRAGDRC